MKQISTKTNSHKNWIMPLLGSLSLIDIALGSLFTGAALGQGSASDYLAILSTGLLFVGCLSLWWLSTRKPSGACLTKNSEAN